MNLVKNEKLEVSVDPLKTNKIPNAMDDFSKVKPVPEVPAEPSQVKFKIEKGRLLMIVLVLVSVVAISLAGYFYSKSRNLGGAAGQDGSQELLEEVGRLIILPEGEQPTIATVTDIELLKGQEFFANAEIGDKVIIYTNAKKAVLYRPRENKIVEVAPLNIGKENETPAR